MSHANPRVAKKHVHQVFGKSMNDKMGENGLVQSRLV